LIAGRGGRATAPEHLGEQALRSRKTNAEHLLRLAESGQEVGSTEEISGAMKLSTLTTATATATATNETISLAYLLSWSLSSSYRLKARSRRKIDEARSLAIPRRYVSAPSVILRAVSVASPGAMKAPGR
jgi:hypothetical protein